MKYTRKDFIIGLECLLTDPTMRTVTVFCGNLADVKQRIRITRRHPPGADRAYCHESLVVTLGRPNYEEREFLALCRKAKTKPRRVWFHFFKPKPRCR